MSLPLSGFIAKIMNRNIKIFNIIAGVFPTRKLKKSLRILVLANAAMVFVVAMFAPFYAVYAQKINANIAIVGLSWAVYPIVAGFLTFLFSRWQMKVKEQELMLALSYMIRGGAFFSYAFMGGILQLILTQILWGIGSALGAPAFDSLYSSHTSNEGSVAEWGQWEGMALMAQGIAAVTSGVIIQAVGYTWLFAAMSTVSFFLGIYIWKLPRELL
jgi:hypothetical protein